MKIHITGTEICLLLIIVVMALCFIIPSCGSKPKVGPPTSKVVSSAGTREVIVITCEDGSIWRYSTVWSTWTILKEPEVKVEVIK